MRSVKPVVVAVILLWTALAFVTMMPNASAVDVPRFLVAEAVGCVATTIITDVDCWSITSGGLTGLAVPDSDDSIIIDTNSGSGGFLTKLGTSFITSGTFTATIGFDGVFDMGDTDCDLTTGDMILSLVGDGSTGIVSVQTGCNVDVQEFSLLGTNADGLQFSSGSSLTVHGDWAQDIDFSSSADSGCNIILQSDSDQAITGMQVSFVPCTLNYAGLGDKIFTPSFATSNVIAIDGPVQMTVTSGTTWTIIYDGISGPTISGDCVSILTIRSLLDGVFWTLDNSAATTTALCVDVKDSHATTPSVDADDGTSVDSGGNVNWDFVGVAPSGICALDNATGLPLTTLFVLLIGISLLIGLLVAMGLGRGGGLSGPMALAKHEPVPWAIAIIGLIVMITVVSIVVQNLSC